MMQEQPKTHAKGLIRMILKGGVLALLVITGGFTGAVLNDRFFAREIVQVDLESLIRAEILAAAESDASEEEKQERVNRFAMSLDPMMQAVSTQGNLLILPSQAIVAGARDITEDVERGLAR